MTVHCPASPINDWQRSPARAAHTLQRGEVSAEVAAGVYFLERRALLAACTAFDKGRVDDFRTLKQFRLPMLYQIKLIDRQMG